MMASFKSQRARFFLRWTEHLLAAIGLGFLVYSATLEMSVIVSDSMSPTLRGDSYANGDRLVLEKVTGRFRPPHRWEIYHYYDNEGNAVAKRVVGLPGEKISLKNDRIFINGVELARPKELAPVKYLPFGNLRPGQEVSCEGGYFMLGDSSTDSYDSRFTGIVARERLIGRAWFIVWPRSRMGLVR